ncbi:TonB-dependent receptor plug domain-containing protein [Oleiharenicola lentus]|uniref:TonB-dependent receptor plug domain-containing protein n=1 Tax=Oleiharenicola lentus TaxID=2508720 RepID=UPI003F6777D9
MVLEKFVTTGSSIKRTDTEKVLPVTVFYAEQIEARDSSTTMDLLQGIPQITNIPSNETSTNAVASRGGNAAAALRGIGAENTLVMFNGRRLPINAVSSLPATSTVNINTLPTVGLAQIEILRDGASALYGADAVAGVINFISKNDVNGGTIQARFGITEQGGGAEATGTINFGTQFAEGKGRLVTTISLFNRDAIYLREREISASSNRLDRARAPWNIDGSVYDGRSAITQHATFRLGTDAVAGTVYSLNLDASGVPTISTAARPRSQYTDYNQFVTGQPSSTRANLFSHLEYDLSQNITVFGEVLGYLAKSRTGRQPITLNSSDARITLSADNPYNPYGSTFYSPTGVGGRLVGTPQAITVTTVLINDGGNENIEASDAMYRVLGGVKGKFGETWSWETAAMLGGYRITDAATNSIRESLLKKSALRTGADAWNPFGYTFKIVGGAVVYDKAYTNPAEVRDFYTESAKRFGHSKIASWDFRTGGEVVDLWAGPIAAAGGVEYRYESKADYKAPYISMNPTTDTTVEQGNNDILVMSPKYNYEADRTIASAYAETVVPLVADKNDIPLTQSLELTGSVRYEKYSDFGNATKPKFGINWKPVKSVMVRASYNKGFRAPDLTTMNQAASFTVGTPPGTRDPVRSDYFVQAGQAVDAQVLNKTYTLPNPNLAPEESEGISAGIVFEVPKVKGLSVSIDYWEIEQNNLIISKTRDATAIADDRAKLLAYTQAQLAAGQNILAINVGSRVDPSSTTVYQGNEYTLRAPVTADDIARYQATYAVLPQNQWIAPLGQWIGASTQEVNGTGKAFTNGFDYEIDYNLPRTPIGQFRLTSTWSQFLNKFIKDNPTDVKNDTVVAMLTPEWRSSTTVQWKKGSWGASLNAVYSSDIRTNAQTTAALYTAAGSPGYIKVVQNDGTTFYYEEGEPTLQLNLGITYKFGRDANKWMRNTNVRFGVNNLLDEEPPLVAATEAGTGSNIPGYSGSNGSSLWIGRAFSVTLTREF